MTGEFSCQCSYPECRVQTIDVELVHKLEMIRQEIKQPLVITSAYRCHRHQVELGLAGAETAVGLSQHELGKAADIRAMDMKRLEELAHTYFDAVGVSIRFLHVDMRADKKRRWTYSR